MWMLVIVFLVAILFLFAAYMFNLNSLGVGCVLYFLITFILIFLVGMIINVL